MVLNHWIQDLIQLTDHKFQHNYWQYQPSTKISSRLSCQKLLTRSNRLHRHRYIRASFTITQDLHRHQQSTQPSKVVKLRSSYPDTLENEQRIQKPASSIHRCWTSAYQTTKLIVSTPILTGLFSLTRILSIRHFDCRKLVPKSVISQELPI